MRARTSLRLVVSVLLASRSTCALLGGWTRRASAVDHRRGVRLKAVELESSDAASDTADTASETTPASRIPAIGDEQQLDLAADQIVPDEWHPDSVLADGPGLFVDIFRSSTPYIKMHRSSTMVIHLDTRVLDEEQLLAELMELTRDEQPEVLPHPHEAEAAAPPRLFANPTVAEDPSMPTLARLRSPAGARLGLCERRGAATHHRACAEATAARARAQRSCPPRRAGPTPRAPRRGC